ncbi:MAG: hypothetical protein AAF456_11945 [Planctomycetota bacterium]
MSSRDESHEADQPLPERRKLRRRASDSYDFEEEHFEDFQRQPRKRRRLWPFVLLLIPMLLFLLPTIVGSTSLKDYVIEQAVGDFDGTVEVERMQLGWFSPVRLSGVTAADANGYPLAEIESIQTSKPLYRFIVDADYGTIEINKPVVHVELRKDGSNLEDAAASFLSEQSPDDQQSGLPSMTININDGSASLSSLANGMSWQINSINSSTEIGGEAAPVQSTLQCQFVDNNSTYGGLGLAVQVDGGATELTGSDLQLAIKSQNLPLSLSNPISERFGTTMSVGGFLNSDMQVGITPASQVISADITSMEVADFLFDSEQLTGTDAISARRITASGQLDLSPTQISGSDFQATSDIGSVKANGIFDLNQLSGLVSGNELINTPLEMDGRIDIARLSRMLPDTLQLYDDLRIQSGELTFYASSGSTNGQPPEGGGMNPGAGRMVVNVEAANVVAYRGEEQVSWDRPIRAVATVFQSPQGMAVENLLCESDFLTVEGSGSIASGSFTAEGDLAKLTAKLGEFADLGDMQLAGQLDGNFGWEIIQDESGQVGADSEPAPIQIGGQFEIESPLIKWPGMPVWQPERFSGVVQASGQARNDGAVYLTEGGGARVDIGNEQFVAVLTNPVPDIWNQPTWQFNCQASGDLGRWLAHVQNFVDIGTVHAAGATTTSFVADVSSQLIRLTNLEYAVEGLEFDGYTMTIREPRAEGVTGLDYDLASGRITFREFSISASAISAASNEFSILYNGDTLLDGSVAFRADVNRIADWWLLQEGDEAIRWFGLAEGQAHFDSVSPGIGGHVNATITDFVAAGVTYGVPIDDQQNVVQAVSQQKRLEELWREPSMSVNSGWRLGTDYDSIAFESLKVDSSGLKADVRGSIAELTGRLVTNLAGTWDPDWQKINGLLDAYTYESLRLTGRGPYPVTVSGPVFADAAYTGDEWLPMQLEASTAFNWESGEVAGLPIGGGQVNVDLVNSVASVATNQIPFTEGWVSLAPQIDMRGSDPVAVLLPGTIADGVTLTQSNCRNWLKYVAPFAADATAARGQFSVRTGDVRIPLFNPYAMDAGGSIRLTNATIGAGPIAQQLIATANQIRSILKPGDPPRQQEQTTWLQLEQQDIPFAVQNGRVYHDGFRFGHRDIQIRTKGSVGFDQSINMVAELPLPDAWLGDSMYVAGLKGRSISIPVSGTLSQPQLNVQAIRELTSQIAREAAGAAVDSFISEEIAPEVQQYRNQLNEQINGGINDLQNRFQEEIGGTIGEGGLLPQGEGLNGLLRGGLLPGGQSGDGAQTPGQRLENRLNDELIDGLNGLFNNNRGGGE